MNNLQQLIIISKEASNALDIKTPEIRISNEFSQEKMIQKKGNKYLITLPSEISFNEQLSFLLRAVRLVWSDTRGYSLDILDAICFEAGYRAYVFQEILNNYISGQPIDIPANEYIKYLWCQIALFGNTEGARDRWLYNVSECQIKNYIMKYTIEEI